MKHLDKNIMEKQIILFPFSSVRSISTLYIINHYLFYFSISSSFISGRTNSSSTIFCLSSSFSSSNSEYSEYSDSSSVFCLLKKQELQFTFHEILLQLFPLLFLLLSLLLGLVHYLHSTPNQYHLEQILFSYIY